MTIERHFGRRPTSKALSRMGLSAALWDIGYRERGEIARPGCAKTNVISVWTRGATYSDLHIDGVRRFSQIRDTGSFQMARAGEALSAVLTKTTGQCLDLYLPTSVIGTALEVECENVALGFELLPTKVAHDPDITRIAADIVLEIASPGVASALALDAATLLLAVTLIRRWSNQAEQIKLPKNGLAPWQVRRALERLGASLHEDISLKDLARDVGLSPFHFARAFKASVGSPLIGI